MTPSPQCQPLDPQTEGGSVQCDDCHHTFALYDIIRTEVPWGTAHRCEGCDEAFWKAQEGEWDGEPTTCTEYWDSYAD